jgi:hypothetical protein
MSLSHLVDVVVGSSISLARLGPAGVRQRTPAMPEHAGGADRVSRPLTAVRHRRSIVRVASPRDGDVLDRGEDR